MKILFELPDRVEIDGVTIDQTALKSALRSEDMNVLRPLINAVVKAKGNERERLFNFLLSGVQYSMEYFVKRTYGYYDHDTQEEIFWHGVSYFWETLKDYDEEKSAFNTWVWNKVRDGSRNARRKEDFAKRLLAKCKNNPALLAEEMMYSSKRLGLDPAYPIAGTPVTTIAGAIGRELNELSRQETNALKKAINSLSENDRNLIVMRVVEQLEVSEIAKLLGDEVTTNKVYVAYSRAIKRLRDRFTKYLVEERTKEV